MKFLTIVGARPNFMKIAPFQRELGRRNHEFTCVHTGQHYDDSMSDTFFEELEIREPEHHLGVGSGSHATQTGQIMVELDDIIDQEDPDWVVVVGDVNSTLAGAIVGAKKSTRVAHIEGGIRSRNRDMPEEINRVVVDQVADAIFCFDQEAVENLRQEDIPDERIWLVGDIMIDSLYFTLSQSNGDLPESVPSDFALLTLHRPSNVDSADDLSEWFDILSEVNRETPIVFPIHPRTENRLEEFGREEKWYEEFTIIPPQSHREFVNLMNEAQFVLTDSGSIQQETTVLGIPCLTLREETERAITVREGTNRLVGADEKQILDSIREINRGDWKEANGIEYWDGETSDRILDVFEELDGS